MMVSMVQPCVLSFHHRMGGESPLFLDFPVVSSMVSSCVQGHSARCLPLGDWEESSSSQLVQWLSGREFVVQKLGAVGTLSDPGSVMGGYQQPSNQICTFC